MTMTIEGRAVIRSFVEHEHKELAAGIDRIHEVARDLPLLPVGQQSTQVGGVLHWVDQTLKPHMAWEESWLFPQIDGRARTPWATRLARFDHRQITDQAERLASHRHHLDHGPSTETLVEIRCDLWGLEALLRASLEREESVLLPVLEWEGDGWTPEWRD